MSRARAWSLLASCSLVLPLIAHEDDGKLRDRRPAYAGGGYRSAVVPSGDEKLGALDFGANGVQLMSWLPLSEFGAQNGNGNSCFGYTSPSGREYAIMGLSNGTGFVEITNPGAPVLIDVIPGAGNNLWRDVRTYQTYCYSVSEGAQGVQVIDLAQIDSGVVTLVNTITTGGDLQTHTLAIDTVSGFLYRAGGGQDNGLRIYSLTNPANPTYVAQWQTKYVHEVSVYTYTSGTYAGKQIAFCCGGFNSGWTNTGLTILDVTNKSNIVQLSSISYSGAAYCHQGWLSTDKQYFYINDEKDETGSSGTRTIVVRVQNLSSPQVVNIFSNGNPAIGHNLYTKANRIYEANYRSGLRIFDTSVSQTNPSEIAWFDTFPDDDFMAFNGLWNVYPYFPSGLVIGSDIERGLFVWWVGNPLLDIAAVNGVPAALSTQGDTVRMRITPASGASVQPGSETLHALIGGTWQSSALVSVGGDQYDANFQGGVCGEVVDWYVSARSQNGFTWNLPQGAPNATFTSLFGDGVTVVQSDDFEAVSGWAGAAVDDTATQGLWFLGDPAGGQTQPEDDRTATPGTFAWHTGPAAGFSQPTQHDVDGGQTSLVSPAYDVTALGEPAFAYWRWYHNSGQGIGGGQTPNEDVFVVQVSNDDGQTWTTTETVGPTGPESAGGWNYRVFRVRDFVTPSATTRVRFVASDYVNPSIVEAAVDEFALVDLDCPGSPLIYCQAKTNSQGCTPAITASGMASASSSQPFDVGASQILNKKNGLLFYGHAQNDAPFQGGTLCMTLPITRTSVQASGGSATGSDCTGTYAYDFNALIQGGTDPSLTGGALVCGQYWSRDPQDPFGFATSLSDAVRFTIAP